MTTGLWRKKDGGPGPAVAAACEVAIENPSARRAHGPAARKGPRAAQAAWALIHRLLKPVVADSFGLAGLVIILLFAAVSLFDHSIAPFGAFDYLDGPDGGLAILNPPGAEFLFGTNYQGQDIFSQTVLGAAVTLKVGLLTGILVAFFGTTVGVVSGYYGGWVDYVLMRIVDVFMGVPALPFIILVITLTGSELWIIIFVFAGLFWRTSARVIRSAVLSIRELQYVTAARAAGASNARIIFVHILPNVAPLAFLYVVFGTGFGVMAEASLSFIGLSDPTVCSWGYMLYQAFQSASMREAWWTVVAPGVCLSLFLAAIFMIGRAYEETLNPRLRRVR